MSSADLAIITAGVAYLATVGTAGAVMFRLTRQRRVASTQRKQAAPDKGSDEKGAPA